MTPDRHPASRFRSRGWFDDPGRIDMVALYLERFLNDGLTLAELRSGKPIIGIAQSGSDIAPCNRVHIHLAQRVREGIRDAGGIPMEFPVHPIFENCRRPTAALDRNLMYLGLVEILHGYPIDAVVLTTACDKTTPAGIMAAATVDIPAIVLSGGPMLDGWYEGELVGSGTVIWNSRRRLAAGLIDEQQFIVMRGAGPIGWPGSAEVVNMQPSDELIKSGIKSLPTIGDGWQSGTSDSPSIVNASPESAVGGGLAWLRTGDMIRIDLEAGRCDMLVAEEEIARRKKQGPPPAPKNQTPWQELYRSTVGQLNGGAAMEFALQYRDVRSTLPRHNH